MRPGETPRFVSEVKLSGDIFTTLVKISGYIDLDLSFGRGPDPTETSAWWQYYHIPTVPSWLIPDSHILFTHTHKDHTGLTHIIFMHTHTDLSLA